MNLLHLIGNLRRYRAPDGEPRPSFARRLHEELCNQGLSDVRAIN